MQTNKKFLVLAADACYAQFYLAHGKQELSKLDYIENPMARLHERDLTSKEHDVNTCPYEGSIKKNHEEETFAKLLVELCNKFLTSHHINEVCIFAAPKFLALLKHEKFIDHTIVHGITKNFMHNQVNLENLLTEQLQKLP